MKILRPGTILRFPKKPEYELDKNGLRQVKCEVIRSGQSSSTVSIPINTLRMRNNNTRLPWDIPHTECHEILDKNGCVIAYEYINKHSHRVENKVFTTCEITVMKVGHHRLDYLIDKTIRYDEIITINR